jgi:hypothetical protein
MPSAMGVNREEGSGLSYIGQGLKGKAGTREEEVSRRREVFRGSLGGLETTGEGVAGSWRAAAATFSMVVLGASGIGVGKRRILARPVEGGVPVKGCIAPRNSTRTGSLGLVRHPWKGALRAKIRWTR